MTYLLVLVVLAAVVLVVSDPLRRGTHVELDSGALREELEAERDAKYREIRDAELDHRMGKLSDADFRTIDRGLRAEAIELLRQIDALPDTEPATAARA